MKQVNSVIKTFAILEELSKNKSIKLTELSRKLGYPSSTTHRFLTSLIDLGYVIQDGDSGEYSLGVKILSLGNSVLQNLDLRKIAYPFLEKLRDKTGETANLVVLDKDEALYIEKVESGASVRVFSLIGRRAPVHATGVGKVLLADLAWPDVISILTKKGMKKLTKNTITDSNEFMEELHKVRQRGYAIDDEECEEGVMCIAAPIKDHTGKTKACISVSGPKGRINEKREKIFNVVVLNARELSISLGYKSEEIS